MKARTLKTIAAFAAFLLWPFGAGATSVLPLDLNQIVAGAERVVHVRCTGNELQPDPNVGIVTVTTFAVLDRAKGAVGPTLTVRQAGGELNGLAIDFHVPKFSVGSEYILFMPAVSMLGLASPVGLSQGVFGVVQGTVGKEVGNGRDFADLIPGADAATVPAGVAARLKLAPAQRSRMDLGDFMTMLRAKVGPQ